MFSMGLFIKLYFIDYQNIVHRDNRKSHVVAILLESSIDVFSKSFICIINKTETKNDDSCSAVVNRF